MVHDWLLNCHGKFHSCHQKGFAIINLLSFAAALPTYCAGASHITRGVLHPVFFVANGLIQTHFGDIFSALIDTIHQILGLAKGCQWVVILQDRRLVSPELQNPALSCKSR